MNTLSPREELHRKKGGENIARVIGYVRERFSKWLYELVRKIYP